MLENSTISTRDDDIVLPSTPTTDSPPFLEINSAEVDDSGVHLLNSCGNRVDRDGQHIPEPELRRLVTASIQQPLQRTANPVDKDTSDERMRLWEEEFDRLERNGGIFNCSERPDLEFIVDKQSQTTGATISPSAPTYSFPDKEWARARRILYGRARATRPMNSDRKADIENAAINFDNLPQHVMDLNLLGDITFSRRTIQRARSSFRVFTNNYWNVGAGWYMDNTNHKRYLRTIHDVRVFMQDNDYYDPILNPAGTKGAPDGPGIVD